RVSNQRWERSMCGAAAACAAALAVSCAAAAPGAPRAALPAARRPAPAAVPASAPPVVNVTATTAEARRAQIRLAGFIQAVQEGKWPRAVTFLSRRVTAPERQQLITGPWLRRTGRANWAARLYMPQ